MKHRIYSCLFGLMLFLTTETAAVDLDVAGQLSGWTTENHVQDEWQNQSGLRYLPQLTVSQMLNDEMFLDLDAALNGVVSYSSDSDEAHSTNEIDTDAELYRLTVRLATAQTETRVGLQKINFGPARLLRSLRWFDQLDQRDPLQLTEAVYAALFRYTALNNANLWLWGLYGNDEVKGFERFPSVDDKIEAGGRFQYPVLTGELAVTLHTRTVNGTPLHAKDFRETRVALDGRWEYGVGMWFESVVQQQNLQVLPYEWTTLNTIGIDYTFGIGNGLYLVLEHMLSGASDAPFGWDEDAQVSAYMLSYLVGLFDSLSAIGFYHWELEEYSQHLSWQRTYDNLVIDLSLFRYPDVNELETGAQQHSGYGGQLMLIYYH